MKGFRGVHRGCVGVPRGFVGVAVGVAFGGFVVPSGAEAVGWVGIRGL